MSNNVIEFEAAIPCDDFRTEDNGKNIIIGSYNEEVVVNSAASNFSFMFVLIGMTKEPCKCNLVITLKVDGKNAVKMETTTEVNGSGHFMMPTPNFNVGIKNGTIISLELTIDGGNPKILRRLKVTQSTESDALIGDEQASRVIINVDKRGDSPKA